MKKIYRVQNDRNEGLYSYAVINEDNCIRHPLPHEDEVLYIQLKEGVIFEQHLFGFGSMQQFHNWLYKDSWKENLKDVGFAIYVYECEEAYIGRTQAVFNKIRRHTLLEVIDITKE